MCRSDVSGAKNQCLASSRRLKFPNRASQADEIFNGNSVMPFCCRLNFRRVLRFVVISRLPDTGNHVSVFASIHLLRHRAIEHSRANYEFAVTDRISSRPTNKGSPFHSSNYAFKMPEKETLSVNLRVAERAPALFRFFS